MVALFAEFEFDLAQVKGQAIDIQLPDGPADAYTFVPEGSGPWPVILFYMDGPGIRPALFHMARRLADLGYFVCLPNLFYRSGAYAPFDPASVFGDPSERERLMKLIYSVNQAKAMADTSEFISWLDKQEQADTSKMGTLGYCMGGPMALSAAGFFPEHVKAAASVHGGRLATDQPDSPHLQAGHFQAGLYIAVAGIDQGFSDAEKQRLEKALSEAQCNFELEIYPGVIHGFAVKDLPVYDHAAAEHHWDKLTAFFSAHLNQD